MSQEDWSVTKFLQNDKPPTRSARNTAWSMPTRYKQPLTKKNAFRVSSFFVRRDSAGRNTPRTSVLN
jgi:hypothetical protein